MTVLKLSRLNGRSKASAWRKIIFGGTPPLSLIILVMAILSKDMD